MGVKIQVVAALIWQADRFLLCQRPAHKSRGLQWEFVGGKVEPGETKQQALIRECREELGVTLSVGPEFMQVSHAYPDIDILLTVFSATIAQGSLQLLEHRDMRWVTAEEAKELDLCPADCTILEKLRKEKLNGKRIDS